MTVSCGFGSGGCETGQEQGEDGQDDAAHAREAGLAKADITPTESVPLAELKERVPNLNGMHRREFEHFIRQYETLGEPPGSSNYPVRVWRFGDGPTFIAL
jgi:hypothetical protein